MMKAAALSLLCGFLICPYTPAAENHTNVNLSVHVKGLAETDSEMILNIMDLNTGSLITETETDHSFQAEIERGGEYLLTLKNCPAGYIPFEEVLIRSEDTCHDLKQEMEVHPFEVRILQQIRNTDLFAEGGKLELLDESDEPVFEFEPDEEGLVKDGEDREFAFEAGHSYILSQKEPAEGYEPGGDILMMIPEFMEESDEPLKFDYFLDETPETETVSVYEPQTWYSFYREPVTPLSTPVKAEVKTEEKKEEIIEVQNEVIPASFSIPEIYLPEKQEPVSRKIESRTERAGFRVRLMNEQKEYLSGAQIAVYDRNGKVIDEWISSHEDHLVQNDQIKEREVYTVRLLKAAEGYSASVPDLEHIAVNCINGNYPVIEIIDRLKKEPAPVTKQQKITKAADYAVAASAGAAGLILSIIAGVFFFGRKRF